MMQVRRFHRQRQANRSIHMPAAIRVQASVLIWGMPGRDALRKQVVGQSYRMTSWVTPNQTERTELIALFRDAQRRVQNSHRAQTPQLFPVSWFVKMCTVPKLNLSSAAIHSASAFPTAMAACRPFTSHKSTATFFRDISKSSSKLDLTPFKISRNCGCLTTRLKRAGWQPVCMPSE
jgi:hypothetical protein